MSSPVAPPPDTTDADVRDRLRAITEWLEAIIANRGLLAQLTPEDRTRLIQAAGAVFNPDPSARRQMVKAVVKNRKADRAKRDDGVLHETGIRTLRRKPVFTTPNVFPPPRFAPHDVQPDRTTSARRASGKPARRTRRGLKRTKALLRLQADVHARSITSTISCARRARRSTSRSAPSWRTCAAASRCSPAAA